MTDKDKIILEDTGVAIADYGVEVLDQIIQNVPGLSLAWGLSKAIYGAGIKLRQKRAMEWVEMIRNNPSVFTSQILADENFQDGFVLALEKFLTERSEKKRVVFKNIFLGFSKAEDKSSFPIEKFIHTLGQLSELDVEVLGDVNPTIKNRNYQVYGANFNRIDNIYNLIGLGLLLDVTGDRVGHNYDESPFVKPTSFTGEFIAFLE